MSIEPTNATKTEVAAATSTIPTASANSSAAAAAEEEEESTLVEISPSSSSSPTTVSSLSPSSRVSSIGTGNDGESHPEAKSTDVDSESIATTVTSTSTTISAADPSEASAAVALAEDNVSHPPTQQQQQQQKLAPVAVCLEQPRNQIPIQSSSSLSTPSSSEEYDEPVTTSSTEGAFNVSSSNHQLTNNNNNNNSSSNTFIEPSQQETVKVSPVESVLLPSPSSAANPAAIAETPQSASGTRPADDQRQAPIEIVQIFPSTAPTSSTSSSSSSSASPSSSTSSTASTSSSPSVSPLAVDQQPAATSSPLSSLVQAEAIAPTMDDSLIAPEATESSDQEVPQQHQPLQDLPPLYQNRSSSSSPQLHSSLKKDKIEESSSDLGRRRVSFPLKPVTGYLEPIDPWACVTIISPQELVSLYRKSCAKHSTKALPVIVEHLKELDLAANQRVPLLSLKDQNLNYSSCEALEEIFKRVQYKCINVSHAGLDDASSNVLFDLIEYYEATNELDISDNLAMTNKSWLACINMVKKSQALNVLVTRGPGISEHHATNLAKALNSSVLHTLKLEHCELSQRPLASLCNLLKRNTVLRELSLAHNQLSCDDAKNIASLLRSNYHIQLLDISNNSIGDKGVEYIVNALIEQSIYFKTVQETKKKSEFSLTDLSSSLNSINSNKNYFPNPYGKSSQLHHRQHCQDHQEQSEQMTESKTPPSPTVFAMSPTPPPLMDATPMTPPPTPALPAINSPSDDVFLSATKLPSPVDSQEKKPPPPEPPHEQTSSEEHVQEEVTSTNNDSGIHSCVSSYVEQTNSDNSNNNSEMVMTTRSADRLHGLSTPTGSEEEKLLSLLASSVSPVTSEQQSSVIESDPTNNDNRVDNIPSTDAESPDHRTDNIGGNKNADGTESNSGDRESDNQTLELAFILDQDQHVNSPKKARLAKQDSVLSEFESSLPEVKQVKLEIVDVNSETRKTAQEPMEEDTPEKCEDYDDDANLKIVEENVSVDRSINASNDEQNEHHKTKDKEEDSGSGIADNEDSASVARLAMLKKDELQLLIEKSKQREQKEEEENDKVIVKPVLIPSAVTHNTGNTDEDNKLEEITSTSAPEKLESIPLKIVETKLNDQPLSRSLDSTGSADFDSSFLSGSQPPVFPNERSFSSESLNSETSVDSNDSKSSLKIIQSKFSARNGTLERQQSIASRETQQVEQVPAAPCGLQMLVLWNNEVTRNSAQNVADLIQNTSTLEILNIGCNLLCNDFVETIKSSLKSNASLTSLGLQAAHLSNNGAKLMADVIEFGGNATLQRIDLRQNNISAPGLNSLNEAMKSNKTVTRIDLDEVPRKAVENEVGPEYTRLLTNIRDQCERNKHPPEPSEPISSSVKRVRAACLNSRKISLTCTSIRASPSATAGEKHHRHLLDPTKKSGGRLRSPKLSPSSSPITSPVPSPSRNRFQVTPVGEPTGSSSSLTRFTNNASTSPSPSSTGSSPTLFFAPNSRFRVVTVDEPKSTSVANNPLGRMSSSSISPSPLVTSGVTRLPPTSSSSAPALSSFVSSPKSTSSPISQSVATNTPSLPVHIQHVQQQQQQQQLQQQQQQHIQPHTPPQPISTPPAPPTPKPKHTRLPSTSSTLNDSVISSTSIDSPDLEVKRFMSGVGGLYTNSGSSRAHSSAMDDSCCSSISSSIDSIDNVNFNNTSLSSMEESFDLVISSPSSSSISVGSISTAPVAKTASSQQEDSTLIPQQQQQQPLLPQTPPTVIKEASNAANPNLLKVKINSLSSLEMSTSSQESLYDVQDLSSVSSSGGSSSLAGGYKLLLPASENSNESTLTSVQNLEKDKQAAATGKSSAEKPPRVRKTSWIASIGNHPKVDNSSVFGVGGGSGSVSSYSPAIEKLLALFIPSYSSNKSSPPNSDCGTVPGAAVPPPTGGRGNASASNLPTRKESPMGGLFQWTKSTKDEEKVLKVNISPENTISPQPAVQMSHSPETAGQMPGYSVESIPSQLKAEIKENISPENTITKKVLLNPTQSPPALAASAPMATPEGTPATTTIPSQSKVIFQVGDDNEDSEDDIDTLTNKFGGGGGGASADLSKLAHPMSSSLLGTSAGSTTTNSSGISIGSSNMADGSPIPPSMLHTSHLGQLARDSLVTMFKNPSLASQESIRSMDSLTEMTEPASQSHHQQQHYQQRQPGTGDTHQAQ